MLYAAKRNVAILGVAMVLVMCSLTGCLAGNAEEKSEETNTQLSPSLKTIVTPEQSVGYSLFYGLVDKDTGKQELTTEEYRQAIAQVFVDAGIGYTAYEAQGAYPTDGGSVVQNTTLVFTGIHGNPEAIKDLVEKTQAELNLESVYCETYLRGYGIYGGEVKGFQ